MKQKRSTSQSPFNSDVTCDNDTGLPLVFSKKIRDNNTDRKKERIIPIDKFSYVHEFQTVKIPDINTPVLYENKAPLDSNKIDLGILVKDVCTIDDQNDQIKHLKKQEIINQKEFYSSNEAEINNNCINEKDNYFLNNELNEERCIFGSKYRESIVDWIDEVCHVESKDIVLLSKSDKTFARSTLSKDHFVCLRNNKEMKILGDDVFYNAINYFDRYCLRKDIIISEIQTIALTCVFIAKKMNVNVDTAFTINFFIELLDFDYDSDDYLLDDFAFFSKYSIKNSILKWEKIIVETLNFILSQVTCNTWLYLFANLFEIDNINLQKIETILKIVYRNYDIALTVPSILAATLLSVSQLYNNALFDDTDFLNITGYDINCEEIKICSEKIFKLYLAPSNPSSYASKIYTEFVPDFQKINIPGSPEIVSLGKKLISK